MHNEPDSIERPSPRRPHLMVLGIILLAVGLLAVIATSALTVIVSDAASLLPRVHHGGHQIAEPSETVINDDLTGAMAELHGHLNWLIWGPSNARLSPSFAILADHTILLAEDQGEDQIAEHIGRARDLVIRDGELRQAHDLIHEAERAATAGQPDRERYTPEPQVP